MARFDLMGNIFGKGKTVLGDLVGGKIVINGKVISVDGTVLSEEAMGVVELVVKEGRVEHIDSNMKVTVHGNVEGNVDAGMSVTCQDIKGNADAGMSITARDIYGKAKAGMSVNAKTVRD